MDTSKLHGKRDDDVTSTSLFPMCKVFLEMDFTFLYYPSNWFFSVSFDLRPRSKTEKVPTGRLRQDETRDKIGFLERNTRIRGSRTYTHKVF